MEGAEWLARWQAIQNPVFGPAVWFVYALLFEDGTAYIGQTGDLSRGVRIMRRNFANSGRFALLETYSTFLDHPGRGEVYRWRYRLGLEGVCIRAAGSGNLYRVGQETLWPEHVPSATALQLGPEVAAWLHDIKRCPKSAEEEAGEGYVCALLKAGQHATIAVASCTRLISLQVLGCGIRMAFWMMRLSVKPLTDQNEHFVGETACATETEYPGADEIDFLFPEEV